MTQVGGARNGRRGPTRQSSRGHAAQPSTIASPRYILKMTSRFEARKQKILEQLDAPGEEYHDLSPKGSVDEPIRDLLREINDLDGLVTTSSCSGRISVFLEGRKVENGPADTEESRAGPGGKGGGGSWLFISHAPVDISNTVIFQDCMSLFGLEKAAYKENTLPSVSCRYIHLKFEPMVSSTAR